MDKFLEILQASEAAIAKVEADLQTVRDMKVVETIQNRVEPLLQKCKELEGAVVQQKAKILRYLIELGLKMGKATFLTRSWDIPAYQFSDRDLVGNGPYSPAELAANKTFPFVDFYSWILGSVPTYLYAAAIEQSKEIEKIRKLLVKLAEVAQDKSVIPTHGKA